MNTLTNNIYSQLNTDLMQLLDNIKSPNINEVRKLIEAGADVNTSKDGITPLMVSCYWNRPDEVGLLLANNANVNLISPGGDTALIEAVRNNSIQIAQMLVNNGADLLHVNNEDQSALDIATRNNQTELRKYLIEQTRVAQQPQLLEQSKFTLNDNKTGSQIGINTNEDVLKHFEQYDKNNDIAKWRESGLIETKSQFHYLDTHNPERVASVLNHEFKTDVKVEPTENKQEINSTEHEFKHDIER